MRGDMASGTAKAADGRHFNVQVFHNERLGAITSFRGDIIGSLVCDKRQPEHVIKLILEDLVAPVG